MLVVPGAHVAGLQNGIVDVCFEETSKVLDVTITSAFCRQCSKMKEKKNLGTYLTLTT